MPEAATKPANPSSEAGRKPAGNTGSSTADRPVPSRPAKATLPKVPKRSTRGDHTVITVSMLVLGASVAFGGEQALIKQITAWVKTKTGQQAPATASTDLGAVMKWVGAYFGLWFVLVLLADIGLGQVAAALAAASAFAAFGYEVTEGHLVQNIQQLTGQAPATPTTTGSQLSPLGQALLANATFPNDTTNPANG